MNGTIFPSPALAGTLSHRMGEGRVRVSVILIVRLAKQHTQAREPGWARRNFYFSGDAFTHASLKAACFMLFPPETK